MVKIDSHIDLLFRDGLRDTEVLPPASVWENIEPVIRKRNNKALFLRIAAGMALLISTGMLAYFYSGGMLNTAADQNAVSALNSLSPLPGASVIDVPPLNIADGLTLNKPALIPADDRRSSENGGDELNQDTGPAQIFRLDDVELSADALNSNLRFDIPPAKAETETEPAVIFSTALVPVEPVDEAGMNKRWKIGAMVSPTYLSTSLKAANQSFGQPGNSENAALSYSGGFSVSYRMSGKLSIQTGLYYSSLGRDITGVSSYSGFKPYASSKSGTFFGVETSSGTVNSTNNNIYLSDETGDRINEYYSLDNFDPAKSSLVPFGNNLRQNFEYLEVPLMLRYKLVEGKMDFNILGGMSYNFLIGNRAWAVSETGTRMPLGSTTGPDNLLLSSSMGLSMEYNLSEQLSLNLEPQIRYFLSTGGDLGSGNPYTFGIFSGMHFRF